MYFTNTKTTLKKLHKSKFIIYRQYRSQMEMFTIWMNANNNLGDF